MGIFGRLFNVGKAEAHSAIDKLEDPIKMTEQGIRDLKKDLDKSLQALAEVKALAIRSKRDLNEQKSMAKNYEQKAMLLLQKAEKGDLEMSEAERLATEALARKEEAVSNASRSQEEVSKFDTNISQLDTNVKKLKSTITRYENELRTLKARARVSQATSKINKQLSGIDSSGTVGMLEKMKDKVAQQEAMAEAYGDIAFENRSLDDEIDATLSDTNVKASNALEELKAKMKNKE
ncbi:PspA/IM30 family protein [Labilibaculum sp. DW002]|jgi:phage shock protein A|uniref:PspA/IM30 family protein n=1 Tax=Paralabilibaculum antarcticum TaxID=2912572 RepID=A0ABT5VVA1_9BACT|nr:MULTISPECIES: PspA/IM30 family protein [unclassified Labilibaculum]MBI9057735.1 PspA/IM30 family protein [Labilibaculum sp.]MDE5419336.1 PspA/IM30 family protein [Labilibaculum sp. DW002]|eukprot:TRINITY_DN131_c0_g1_i1.p1 TRINITY_DN131_c0_g1~~TRINITY_DN131_c0_g1_i1.p1  ORF type:complete len:235 (+),score=63.12 TRINITY_DN131_c0_g1_i1:485-1189(+)